jgi:hypothetical protein
MPKYLSMGSYSVDGIKGVLKEGVLLRLWRQRRRRHLRGAITAAALAIGIGSTGTVSLKTTVLITPEELDEATRKTVAFRAAGR